MKEPRRIPSKRRFPQQSKPLGDAVKDFLDSHGITKEWWAEFLEKYNLPPCNCDANQTWINETASAHPTIENIGVKFLAALTRKK